jgi:PIN domain
LPTANDLAADFSGQLDRDGFKLMAISAEHAIRAGLLPGPHKDPFDRMLIAQAQAENMPVISNETVFATMGSDEYGEGVPRRARADLFGCPRCNPVSAYQQSSKQIETVNCS